MMHTIDTFFYSNIEQRIICLISFRQNWILYQNISSKSVNLASDFFMQAS